MGKIAYICIKCRDEFIDKIRELEASLEKEQVENRTLKDKIKSHMEKERSE
jgi:hypothetical protein